MKEVLFATTNPAKIKSYEGKLKEKGIKLKTIKDLNINIEIEENGKNAIENACIKAKTYYDITKIPTIGMDNNLFIEELPEEKQPGTHVRRINGKYLTDDEMIEYYTKLVKEYGGKLTAKWVYGMAVYNEKGKKTYTWSKDQFYFDACYNPAKTQFLLDAEEAGATILNGLGMSLYQGAAQIEYWTGQEPPIEAMRQKLLDIISEK